MLSREDAEQSSYFGSCLSVGGPIGEWRVLPLKPVSITPRDAALSSRQLRKGHAVRRWRPPRRGRSTLQSHSSGCLCVRRSPANAVRSHLAPARLPAP